MKTKTLVVYALLLAFLLLNLVSSQSVSNLFYDLVRGNKSAGVEFLKKVRNESFFSRVYTEISGFFEDNLEEEVYSETLERQKKITELESILKQNPKSRDAFYSLYTLYLLEGDEQAAQKYLLRAQEIDPEVKP